MAWEHGEYHTLDTLEAQYNELLLHITEVRNMIISPIASSVDGQSWSREGLLVYLNSLNAEKTKFENMLGKNKKRIVWFMQGR